MSHGYAAIKELYLAHFAEVFATAGFAVLVYDSRNCGESGGLPRGEIDPMQQVSDARDAITWLQLQPDIDPHRIGVWGSSFSGGHAIVLAALDKRVRCVVAQVPTIDSYESFLRRNSPHRIRQLRKAFVQDRIDRYQGHGPKRCMLIPEADNMGIYNGEDAVAFYRRSHEFYPHWDNSVTLRSVELSSEYEPQSYIYRLGMIPVLMIVAEEDDVTPTDLALDAYARIKGPKHLSLVPCGHFDLYVKHFEHASHEACTWFKKHL